MMVHVSLWSVDATRWVRIPSRYSVSVPEELKNLLQWKLKKILIGACRKAVNLHGFWEEWRKAVMTFKLALRSDVLTDKQPHCRVGSGFRGSTRSTNFWRNPKCWEKKAWKREQFKFVGRLMNLHRWVPVRYWAKAGIPGWEIQSH